MFIMDTSSQLNSLKLVDLAQYFYCDSQVGGGEINWPGQLTHPPLQLSIQNNLTKKAAELELNYVYN